MQRFLTCECSHWCGVPVAHELSRAWLHGPVCEASDKANSAEARRGPEVAGAVVENLEKASSMALTTDLWTSRRMEVYITITVHFINESWHIHSTVSVADLQCAISLMIWALHTGR